jgi:hypothetical protein
MLKNSFFERVFMVQGTELVSCNASKLSRKERSGSLVKVICKDFFAAIFKLVDWVPFRQKVDDLHLKEGIWNVNLCTSKECSIQK